MTRAPVETYAPRVVPCLLLQGDALVKTTRFARPVYVGDPLNVLSIFSAFEADEILLLDVGATPERRRPPFDLLAKLAQECLVPTTYGGGLTSLDDIRRIIDIGYERVVLNTALDTHPSVVSEAARVFGSQAVVASIDAIRLPTGGYDVRVEGGTRGIGMDPAKHASRAQELGVGEILITSIDRDGTMEGYDLDLIRSVADAVTVPVVACGGAGTSDHLVDAFRGGAAAVAAGSMWVFQGKNRGVLIHFPRREHREALFS